MNFNYLGGTTVYIKQSNSDVQYSTDQTSWNNVTFPATITNTNISLGFLKIEFITNITLTTINDYFICSSSYIQFGSTSLKNDGTRPTIIVNSNPYGGLIQNGAPFNPGYSNINIYNLIVDGTGGILEEGGGWIGRINYAFATLSNYIINCSSYGSITTNGGGIAGSDVANGGGEITIIGCSSFGNNIGLSGGGIVGLNAGLGGGSVTCKECFSTGDIGSFCGGIFGEFAGRQGGKVIAFKCFSTGIIGTSGGGIYGRFAGYFAQAFGITQAENCYSRGLVSTDAGGIYGVGAGTSSDPLAKNCYSSGVITTTGNGIYGSGKNNGTEEKCYIANNNWSDVTAQLSLLNTPLISNVGKIWVKIGNNNPYELNNIGYTPYSINNIDSSYSLIQSFSQTISSGSSTIVAFISGKSYEILDISQGGSIGSYPTITINSTTGSISVANNTISSIYTIYIRNLDYTITQFDLTVNFQENNLDESYILFLVLQKRYRRRKYPWLYPNLLL